MKVNIRKEGSGPKFHRLQWAPEELNAVEERILKLRRDQLVALPYLVGITFSRSDIEEIVEEILGHKHDSINLGALTEEADSKENLLWWVGYFELHRN